VVKHPYRNWGRKKFWSSSVDSIRASAVPIIEMARANMSGTSLTKKKSFITSRPEMSRQKFSSCASSTRRRKKLTPNFLTRKVFSSKSSNRPTKTTSWCQFYKTFFSLFFVTDGEVKLCRFNLVCWEICQFCMARTKVSKIQRIFNEIFKSV